MEAEWEGGRAAISPALARTAGYHTVACPFELYFQCETACCCPGTAQPLLRPHRRPALPLPGGPTCNTPKVH